ncbi:MAG TPA: VWA domain-containing protein [Verrucomicrobiae bacterium]|nr:VWA domain-containing protein [Verrucomicrobiae bacterium]
MTWGLPSALLLLFAALPAIVILHSLRPRGRRVGTTTLFLWERVLKERQMGQWLGRLLKKNLSLLLQLLAAVALIAALADPRILWLGGAAGDTIVVIDQSASMKAKGRGGSRFDDARAEVLRLIDALPSGGRMMIVGAGPRPEILSTWTDDRARLRAVARSVRATDAAVSVKDAVLFAYSFLKRGGGEGVVVVSDGAFDGAEELPWSSAHLAFVKVGAGGENVGITGFELRRLPDQADRHEAMVTVKNFTSRQLAAPLTLSAGEENWARETLDIAPGESRVLIYPHGGALPERLEARLDVADDFPTDNRAYLAVRSAAPLRVLYVGPGNRYLDHLFYSMPWLQVTRAGGLAAVDFRLYDAVVFDGVAPPALTEGDFVLINAAAKPIEARGRISHPRLLPSAARHPVSEGASFDDLSVREALRLTAPGGASVVLGSRDGPLVFVVEQPRLKGLVIGFDLAASDLPWRVAFPVLFNNVFEWFRPRGGEFPGARVEAGKPYAIRLAADDGEVQVTTPSGARETLRAFANPLPFTETLEAGFYSYKSSSGTGQFAVNLLSETESDIHSRVPPAAASGARRTEGRAEATDAGFSLWPMLLLLAAAALLAEAWLIFSEGAAFYPLMLRGLAAAAVLFALWNPKIFHAAKALDVILAVDASRSVGQEGKAKALEILEEARRLKTGDARAGLLFFGRRPSWEFFPRADPPLADFSPDVGREETDIEAALEAPAAQIGAGREGKILLISDGNQTRGEVARALPFLRSHGIAVSVLPVSLSGAKNEVYVSELLVPQQAESGATFEIKGAIESRAAAEARVKLVRDGVIRREEPLALRAGANWIAFKQTLAEPGSHTYELWVESDADTLPENNRLQGIVEVRGPPRALYLYSSADGRRAFAAALKTQGYAVIEATPERSPLTLGDLASYDLVVLDNVPAYRLTQAKMETIERYVRDLGGGLIVVGGPQSYGAGGYYRTPLERILPLEMRPPSRLELPHVALLFVLDKSGSMAAGPEGSTKLDLAKSAALAAADLLNPQDQVGILTFDAAWNWLLPFRAVGKGEWISERLAEVQSDGGTDLYKAMVEAERALAVKQASIKHLLILSDGLTDKADFEALVAKMTRAGVTVSTVAIGDDADLGLMAAIARNGKGRGYVALDPQTVPQIFTSETLLISRDLLVEKTVRPKMNAALGALKGFAPERLPPLLGYVLTHAKAESELLMQAGDDPLLVSWRYGLGKVAAFTSDLTGRWGREWIAWRDFPQWAGQLARSARRSPVEHRLQAEFRQQGDEVAAVVDLLNQDGGFADRLTLKGNLTAAGRPTSVASFQQIAPGRYEARLSAGQSGAYLLTLHEEKKGAAPSVLATVPFVVPYPREYRELTPNLALLSRIAEETGGELLRPDQPEQGVKRLFTPDPAKATAARALWQPLAGLGLLLFLADLAARRWPRRTVRSRESFAETVSIA